jgi:hypothetical protein
MASAFERPLHRAHATANRLAGVTVIYRRPSVGQQVELIATLGSTRVERSDSDGDGAIVTTHARDYILGTADLVLDGQTILPVTGDQILETIGAAVFIHEVRPHTGDGQPWSWHGPARDAVRVQTRQIATES